MSSFTETSDSAVASSLQQTFAFAQQLEHELAVAEAGEAVDACSGVGGLHPLNAIEVRLPHTVATKIKVMAFHSLLWELFLVIKVIVGKMVL